MYKFLLAIVIIKKIVFSSHAQKRKEKLKERNQELLSELKNIVLKVSNLIV